MKPYLLLAPVCDGLMPCQVCPASNAQLSDCMTAWELAPYWQLLTLVRGTVSIDQDSMTCASCTTQWVWHFRAS